MPVLQQNLYVLLRRHRDAPDALQPTFQIGRDLGWSKRSSHRSVWTKWIYGNIQWFSSRYLSKIFIHLCTSLYICKNIYPCFASVLLFTYFYILIHLYASSNLFYIVSHLYTSFLHLNTYLHFTSFRNFLHLHNLHTSLNIIIHDLAPFYIFLPLCTSLHILMHRCTSLFVHVFMPIFVCTSAYIVVCTP